MDDKTSDNPKPDNKKSKIDSFDYELSKKEKRNNELTQSLILNKREVTMNLQKYVRRVNRCVSGLQDALYHADNLGDAHEKEFDAGSLAEAYDNITSRMEGDRKTLKEDIEKMDLAYDQLSRSMIGFSSAYYFFMESSQELSQDTTK